MQHQEMKGASKVHETGAVASSSQTHDPKLLLAVSRTFVIAYHSYFFSEVCCTNSISLLALKCSYQV